MFVFSRLFLKLTIEWSGYCDEINTNFDSNCPQTIASTWFRQNHGIVLVIPQKFFAFQKSFTTMFSHIFWHIKIFLDRSFENVIYHKPTVTTLLIRLGKCYLGVIYNPVISETIHGIKNSVRARNNRETIVMDSMRTI